MSVNRNDLVEGIQFCYSQPLEFFTAMYTVTNRTLFADMYDDLDIAFDPVATKHMEHMESSLSRYLQEELRFFCGLDQPTDPQALHPYAYYYPDAQTVPELIDRIENSPPSLLIDLFIDNFPDDTAKRLKQMVPADGGRGENRGLSAPTLDTPGVDSDGVEMRRFLECLADPQEAQVRLVMLLKGFYEKAYAPLEQQIEAVSREHIAIYTQLFQQDPVAFIESYLKVDVEGFTRQTRIHVSFLTQVGVYIAFNRPGLDIWVRLGSAVHQLWRKRADEEQAARFLKAVSDGRRLEIVRMLVKRSWYGQELAEVLGLTPSAVVYHMAFLFDIGVLATEKADHRVYYRLDKEKLASLFDLAKSTVLA